MLLSYFQSTTFHEKQLVLALNYGESNRTELDKVLVYCQNDSLKLEAAKFLIRNMSACYSYQQGGDMQRYGQRKTCITTDMETVLILRPFHVLLLSVTY